MYFLGVDVSKQKIDVCLLNGQKAIVLEKVVNNTKGRILQSLKSIQKKISLQQLLVCCENTGIYGVPLEKACEELGIDLWVENANKIKRASTDLRGKTDKKDAYRIACYAVRYQDLKRLHKAPSEWKRKMKTLLQAREDLLKEKTGLNVRLGEAKSHDPERYKILNQLFAPVLKALEKQIQTIYKEIKRLQISDEQVNQNIDLLTSIPGVGLQNALQMIIHTDNFQRFESAKHLACYAGVAPFPNQSGNSSKPDRVSKHANQILKRLLHMAAMAAVRSKSDLKVYYARKLAQGKNKMSVLNAVRNKLVQRMFAVIKRQKPYEPDQDQFLSKQKFICRLT